MVYYCFSSLRSLIEKPPITGKELNLLSGSQLTGFRLHPGPVSQKMYLFHSICPGNTILIHL